MADTLIKLGLALAVGLIVGMERGWQERSATEGSRIAGVRTFGLIGLLGGLSILLSEDAGRPLFGLIFLGFSVLMAISHFAEARENKDYGITTLVAALITFSLGALSVRGQHAIAGAVAVATAVILSAKPVLHKWLQRIEAAEFHAALKLLLISVVILPVLPDEDYGPWGALNPYELWWLVVLIAGISFAAYCAVKLVGTERGILLTGLLGGLASSTGVSIHLARLAKTIEQTNILAAGVLVASATMFVRVLLVVTIINRDLSLSMRLPYLAMAATLFVAAAVYARKNPATSVEAVKLRNPVELGEAIKFAILLAGILLLGEAVQMWLGQTGIVVLAAIAGVADVDAITISVARMTGSELSLEAASRVALLAATVNTLAKGVLVRTIGGQALGRKVLGPMALCLFVGGLTAWLISL